MTRDCRHSTGDDQRLQTQYRWPETADSAGDDQTLQTGKEMTRDCGPLGREGERVPEFDRSC
ncbi:unnamed protein product, partial [Staurois parvus]